MSVPRGKPTARKWLQRYGSTRVERLGSTHVERLTDVPVDACASIVSPAPRPDEVVELHELRSAIDGVLASLTPKEATGRALARTRAAPQGFAAAHPRLCRRHHGAARAAVLVALARQGVRARDRWRGSQVATAHAEARSLAVLNEPVGSRHPIDASLGSLRVKIEHIDTRNRCAGVGVLRGVLSSSTSAELPGSSSRLQRQIGKAQSAGRRRRQNRSRGRARQPACV